MPKFIVERTVPGFGSLPPEKVNDVANRVRIALNSIGGRVHWLETFVTQDKLFTILIAPDEAIIREYSKVANLAVDKIHLVKSVLDYSTGE